MRADPDRDEDLRLDRAVLVLAVLGLMIDFGLGSSLLISTSTGAPAAFARSLGHMLMANGTAAAITPTAPTAVVAPSRNRRFVLFTPSSVAIRPVSSRKPIDYK